MTTARATRLAEVIRTETADILRGLRDPRLGFVSITEVEVSADLRHARVYVSVLGDETAKSQTMAALARARGRIRSALAARVRIRFVPEILFRLDDSIERGERVVSLLREVVKDDAGGAPGGDRPDAEG